MPEGDEFAELVRRIRSGDAEATQQLIRQYEPAIRREARLRLGPSLRPMFDSMDLCQSVLGSFFVRVVAGQYELNSPGGVMRLLLEMTRNKIREKARKRREASLGTYEPISADQNPIEPILHRDFIAEFSSRLSEEELALWERRRQDIPWQVIATELGGAEASLRQRYSRAIRRVAMELGLGEVV
ncbi:sigma-70 family RNA polymerase sigma factor [Singulisphaera sp. Ch08]|uniref:Sigma-70 family RNA polymerase sigma factor n=1 Tax=Singulisphaera sp. Ch08 TaxID=3120278 RepID=A0AAU7CLV2_9BACT